MKLRHCFHKVFYDESGNLFVSSECHKIEIKGELRNLESSNNQFQKQLKKQRPRRQPILAPADEIVEAGPRWQDALECLHAGPILGPSAGS